MGEYIGDTVFGGTYGDILFGGTVLEVRYLKGHVWGTVFGGGGGWAVFEGGHVA